MMKTPYTSRYSAVLLSSLLVVVVGLTSQSARSLQRHERDLPSTAETQEDAQSHTKPNGEATLKGEIFNTGDPASWHSYGSQLKPQLDEKFLYQRPLNRDLSGYLAKHMPCRHYSSGCRLIIPAEEAANSSPQQDPPKYFECLATVVCLDECRLKCTATVETSVQEKPLAPAGKENEQLVKFDKNVTSQGVALDVKLAKLLIEEFDYQKEKLNEIGQQLDHFTDALKDKLGEATASTLESVDSRAREVKAFLNEKTELMRMTLSSELSTVAINPKTHRWTLTGYARHKGLAILKGLHSEMGEEVVYLQHYLISWGIRMKAEDGVVTLYLLFKLHKGRNDDVLDWPFSNRLKLCLIHPETQEEECDTHKPKRAEASKKYFGRPLEDSNKEVCLLGAKFESSYIEENGFIKADKLLLKVEVES
ncbi:uncharacterized protein LOC144167054 [Haemaphysalis longicornis]